MIPTDPDQAGTSAARPGHQQNQAETTGRRRIRLSYANVVASLALFAALGGSSYAAISITGKHVRDGSLSGRDVRNASLTSGDVRDQSLLAQDFKQGQLPAGPKGDKGDPGAPGQIGPKGDKGEPGPAGPGARWAEITTNGPDATIVAQSGGFSITNETTGQFTLDTGASTQGKAVLASLRPGTSGNGATVQVQKSGANGVFVETYNSVGTVVSEDFTVVVL